MAREQKTAVIAKPRLRFRRDKSTKFFDVISIEDLSQKKWKKTDKWKEAWF